jgi:SlyX protein
MTELPDSSAAGAQARLTELETKLAFAEDLLETLNQTVIRQQAQIDLLQQQLRLLHERLQDALPVDDAGTLRDDIPPHY